MVETQIARRGVSNASILAAMRDVPREAFVDEGFEEFAYEDNPLPIAENQTISQPYIVALMLEACEAGPTDSVLEIGVGSGYVTAVLSRIAAHVHGIERHSSLTARAQERLDRLGYHNVELHTGDGTRGWPQAAPFDVILVSAGGPEVPRALKEQLAIGGRLVIPVGVGDEGQILVKLVRDSAMDFSTETLGQVKFVPLIGEQGWAEDEPIVSPKPARTHPESTLPRMIADAAEPLPDFDNPAFAPLFDRFADKRIVLLGEASHGTAEFYRGRAAITRHLLETHGFTIVAVEADWPDAAAIDRYVRHRPTHATEPPFQRFPTWMWRNTEVDAFVEWLRSYNEGVAPGRRAGFYGLDIYNMNGAIGIVLDYLDTHDPEAAAVARDRYGCLTPWQKDPSSYGRAVLTKNYHICESAVVAQCRDMLARYAHASDDDINLFDATQNARLVATAEHYYRAMYCGSTASWNLRDTAMFETLEHLLKARGENAKAVVWAHNSHIGDARFTEMGTVREELNIGQLCRQRFGDEVALIGFGTHADTVAAATDWGGDMEIKQVLPPHPGSYEDLCHASDMPRFALDLKRHETLRKELLKPRLERFIGVIYRPETELASHYIQATLPQQFDAFVWFDQTTALTPLGPQHAKAGAPETYPFGL